MAARPPITCCQICAVLAGFLWILSTNLPLLTPALAQPAQPESAESGSSEEGRATPDSPTPDSPTPDSPTPDSPTPGVAERPAATPRATGLGIEAGSRRYVPEKWSIVRGNFSNPTDETFQLQVSSFLGSDSTLQFGRRFSMPPQSKRTIWYPLRVPAVSDGAQESLAICSQVEVLRPDRGELETRDGVLRLHQGHITTALVVDHQAAVEQTDWEAEAVRAIRSSQQQTIQIALLDPHSLPPTPEALEGLSQLVLASRNVSDDGAAIGAIRSWLFRGGRLWILLDRCDDRLVSQLVGDQLPLTIVERVDVIDGQIECHERPADQRVEPLRFEQPVDFVRVLHSNADVTHSLDGWPVALRQRVGNGLVFVTMLGTRGLLRERRASDPQPRSVLHESRYFPREPLLQVAGELIPPRKEPGMPEEVVRRSLTDQIGYRTVPRLVMVGILGGFCLAVVGGIGWFAGRGRAEWAAALAGVSALLTTAVILGLGWSVRHSAPLSVASFQLVRVLPNPTELDVEGRIVVYSPTPLVAPLGVRRGGIVWPDQEGLGGAVRQMIFTDLDRYHWEKLRLPPGDPRTLRAQMTRSRSEPVTASATFTDRGFRGVLHCDGYANPRDALLATPDGQRMAVRVRPDGTFEVAGGAVLDRRQFTSDTLLTDEQRRHRDIYAALFLGEEALFWDKDPERRLSRTSLLVWADPPPLDWQRPDGAEYLGAALLVVPLRLREPENQERVTIPSPLVEMRAVVGPRGQAISTSFDNRKRQWMPQSLPAQVHLRFSVPEAVRPFQVERAVVRLRMDCPTRTVDLVGFDQQRVIPLLRGQGLVDREVTVSDSRALQLDPDGHLLLGIYVDQNLNPAGESGPEGGAETVTSENETQWLIEDVRVELQGRTVRPPPPE